VDGEELFQGLSLAVKNKKNIFEKTIEEVEYINR
jgi:hypothetical protein